VIISPLYVRPAGHAAVRRAAVRVGESASGEGDRQKRDVQRELGDRSRLAGDEVDAVERRGARAARGERGERGDRLVLPLDRWLKMSRPTSGCASKQREPTVVRMPLSAGVWRTRLSVVVPMPHRSVPAVATRSVFV
jgi:hypothetical protein